MFDYCPVCESGTGVVRFEWACDKDGQVTEILQCRDCLALFNGRAHVRLAGGTVQDIQLTDFYLSGSLSEAEALEALEGKARLLEYLYEKVRRPYGSMTFCDFGGGAGFVAMAATKMFKKSYICEFDTRSVEQVCSVLGKPSNLSIVGSFEEISDPVDVICMWHVLEHIPKPLEFIRSIQPYLAKGCIFFVQCPGYRPDALVDCHYTFFNEPSFKSLFAKAGVREIEIGFDTNNGFVGYLGELE